MIIAFFGHSDFVGTSAFEEKMRETLKDQINDFEAELLFGGYGGFDRFAFECGRRYQKENPNVKLIFVIPYLDRKYEVAEEYDEIVYPPLEKVPYRFAIVERNKWMVDRADIIISCVTRECGGAFKAVNRALKKNKKVINII